MAFSERLAILITADGAGAVSEFKKVGDSADKELGKAETASARMSAGFTKAGIGMMTTSAVLVAGMWKMGQSAAELEQAVGGTEAVFKDTAGTIDVFAKSAAETTGLSESMARTLTTRLGGALKGLGFDTQEAADQAVGLTKVAADLAATYGGTTADAVTALSAAFRGEFDPAEQFNLFLKQSAVDAKAVEMGLAATTAEVDANARAQATLALIMEQSTDAQGQFAREADTVSGQMARSQAKFEDMKAELGAGFMPIMSKAADIVSGVTGGLSSLDQATNGALSTFTAFAAVGLGVVGVISTVIGKASEAKKKFQEMRASVGEWTATKSMVGGFATSLVSAGAVVVAYQQQLDRLRGQVKELGDSFVEAGKTKLAEDGFDRVNHQLEVMDASIASVVGEIEAYNGSNNPFEQVLGALENEANLEWLNELQQSRAELVAYRDEVQRVMDTHGYSRDEAIAYVDAVKEGGETAGQATGLLAAYREQVEETGTSWSDAEKALKGYLDAQWGMINASAAAEEAIDSMLDSIKESGTLTTDEMIPAGRENLDLLQDLQRAALDAGFAEAQKTGSMDAGIAKSVAYRQKLEEELIARYGNTEAVRAYIDKLNLTPDSVRTAFETAGLDDAIAKTGELHRQLMAIVAATTMTDNPTFQAALRVLQSGGHMGSFGGPKAAGGPVSSGQTYLVGENGPELFTPGTSGSITPNHALGGGTQTVIVQVDGREIARAIVDRERAA